MAKFYPWTRTVERFKSMTPAAKIADLRQQVSVYRDLYHKQRQKNIYLKAQLSKYKKRR